MSSSGLVTSTFRESEMFADAGFDDILYAYPLIEAHMERNLKLADRLEDYHVMIANREGLETLLQHDPPSGKKWQVRPSSRFQTMPISSPVTELFIFSVSLK